MTGNGAGTGNSRVGTSGGDAGMNGAARRLAIAMASGFTAVLVAVTIGNAESMISDFAAAGVRETKAHIWIWQVTSVAAWLSVTPLIWWAVARIRPPRFSWPAVAAVAVLGVVVASAWHIGVMIALRHLVYAVSGESYVFQGGLKSPYLYEFRKDVATYLQFVGLAALAQWLLARVGAGEPSPPGSGASAGLFEVTDGRVVHSLPIDTIDYVTAAGNYVEIAAEGRTLLHRATLSAVETELGPAFVRIHRSRIVRRGAVRRMMFDRSGDFVVSLERGEELRGSRRYRDQL